MAPAKVAWSQTYSRAVLRDILCEHANNDAIEAALMVVRVLAPST
jgi:hypothetical protein